MDGKKHNLKQRKGEKIGGGYIIMRRHTTSGRVKVNPTGMPFEHPDIISAMDEMRRLAHANPGKKFCILQQVADCVVTEQSAAE
jgi:hypothetical protein